MDTDTDTGTDTEGLIRAAKNSPEALELAGMSLGPLHCALNTPRHLNLGSEWHRVRGGLESEEAAALHAAMQQHKSKQPFSFFPFVLFA